MIDKYQLSLITGLSAEKLMLNYKSIISYLQRPSGGYLELPDFVMSEAGMIHFADVKNIFLALYIIVLLFIVALGIFIVMKHQHKDKCILSIFNQGANLVFIVFGVFRNDYWVFDYRTDPVILALPEQLFMLLSIIIIVFLFVVCGLIKYTYYKMKKSNN